jgi:regulation of enolase protein 1 (concanavalin A-like superfamily)
VGSLEPVSRPSGFVGASPAVHLRFAFDSTAPEGPAIDLDQLRLPNVPFPLEWDIAPEHFEAVVSPGLGETGLLIEAGPLTDLFVSPDDLEPTLNAPRLLGVPDRRFQLSALVEVEFGSTFDAGVLLLWAHERSWAKLCLEFSPAGQPMVVSVVTRDRSDDANSMDVEGPSTWLRISNSGAGSYAFHAATDGVHWNMVRHFHLGTGPDDVVRLGFLAQSPTGDGCRASFSQLRYVPEALDDLRGGD